MASNKKSGALPEPVHIRNESQLMTVLMQYINMLTCYNCGDRLVEHAVRGEEREIGVLHLEHGHSSTREEPEESDELYFECVKCKAESDARANL
jgi:hypothetical protein